MDRQIIEGMLGDALEREIITAKMVDGAYPPAVAVGILDGRGGEIGFGHGESQLTVILPDIGDCARFVDSCKALGGKVPLGTYGGELVSAMARELGPEETAERDRIRAQAAARVREAKRHRREAECLFEYRFSCSPYSAMAYEAFHPELCERRVSKHRKQELVVYRLPDGSEPSGYAEMSVPADYADSSHVVPSVFISGTGGDRAWRDIDFDEAERKFAAAARRAAAFREGRPKLMQDEARRAAIRETRHRVCTAPILKSIKEIHR